MQRTWGGFYRASPVCDPGFLRKRAGPHLQDEDRRLSCHRYFFSMFSAATNGVLVAGPSPHTRMVAGSVLAPSKCTPLAQWITCVPAGIGTVASGSNLPPLPTHQVPEITMKKRSFGWKCGRLMLPGSQVSSIA